MNQQPLSNAEVLDLCLQIAKILQNNDESKSSIEAEIEKAIKTKIIESYLEKYILIPKYKSL